MSLWGRRPAGLALGQEFRLRNAGTVGIVGQELGAGGQGAVHLCDVGGRRLALKWYHPHVIQVDGTLRQRIERLICEEPPDKRFLFPVDLATVEGRTEFGYVMPIVSPDRRPFSDTLARPPNRLDLTLEARATACFEIAESMERLHTRGLCYQDVNLGSLFVDPVRGGILICDPDNITSEGRQGGVLGTPKFMAPEIVRGSAIPSSRTDLYSMAVLFFYALFQWHPLDGCLEAAIATRTPETDRRLYGTDPVFIFDPRRDENRPVAGAHDWIVARWAAMPAGLRELFVRAFTAGLLDPDARPLESEWRGAMARLRDAVTRCPACTFEISLEAASSADPPTCPACGGAAPRPTRLSVGRYLVSMPPSRQLYDHHIGDAPLTLRTSVGSVDAHPSDQAIVGLRNLTGLPWQGRTGDGRPVTITPGRTVRILHGLDIDFGQRRGLVAGADDDRSAA